MSDRNNLPSEPTATCGTLSVPGPSDVAVQGGYAYVADAEAGLSIIAILPPYEELAAVESPALARRLAAVEGSGDTGLVYLACGPNGLKVVEISDTTVPDDPGASGCQLRPRGCHRRDGCGGICAVCNRFGIGALGALGGEPDESLRARLT